MGAVATYLHHSLKGLMKVLIKSTNRLTETQESENRNHWVKHQGDFSDAAAVWHVALLTTSSIQQILYPIQALEPTVGRCVARGAHALVQTRSYRHQFARGLNR